MSAARPPDARAALPATPLQATDCPLCGRPNACAVAACGRFDVTCWCRDAAFGPDLAARVPEAQRGAVCICAACAKALEPVR